MVYYFRNDDVRDTLDESLVNLTNVFIKHQIPICHAVEPANVSTEVVEWLLDLKAKHPGIIEIVQHGYNHKLNFEKVISGKLRKGEFGGERSYDDQLKDIKHGKELMDKNFRDQWFEAFTFPFGARNKNTIKAINDIGYKVVNGGVSNRLKNKAFYFIGRMLNREIVKGHKVSYHMRYKPKTKLFQIDIALSVIKKYINSNDECNFYSLDELKQKTNGLKDLSPVGILFHHRYHKNQESIKLIDQYLEWLKSDEKNNFLTQKEIFLNNAK